jgi:hypothetical protein
MISLDFECDRGHRFEGYFNDYEAYKSQLDRKIIVCPLCESTSVTRKFTGCSIQAKPTDASRIEKMNPNLFDAIRAFNRFVRDNYENVGQDFADTARAMHYGFEEQRNIYGESSLDEIEELREEGIGIVPLLNIEDIEN